MALSVIYFRITHRLGRPHYVWEEYLLQCIGESSVRVTVYVSVCLVCVVWDDDERKGEGETRCRLFSESSKGAARLNVSIRRTNRYQQYYMPSQHTYCGRVCNLIQACDVQSSDQKVYISTPPVYISCIVVSLKTLTCRYSFEVKRVLWFIVAPLT